MKNIIIQDNNLPYILNNINYPTGGASVQTRNWMYGFEELGYKIIIISSTKVKNKTNYNIININNRVSSRIAKFFLTIYSNYKVLKKYKPSFIYVSTPHWTNIHIGIAAKILRFKIVQRISNDNIVDERAKLRFGKVKYILFRFYLSMVKIIACQNQYQLDHIKKQFPNKKSLKIYNPFLIVEQKNVNTKRNYIAWIGIFQEQKNLPALFEIIKKSPNLNFKIAGKRYQNIDNKTNHAIECLKKLENVEFVGLIKRDEIMNFLKNAICLLNTSRYEGFSNTFLEAFSVGTPVVTRAITDPDQIISNYNLGCVCSSYHELQNQIQKIASKKYNINLMKKYLFINHDPFILSKKIIKFIHNEND